MDRSACPGAAFPTGATTPTGWGSPENRAKGRFGTGPKGGGKSEILEPIGASQCSQL